MTGFGTCGGAGCAGLAGARPPANPALARLAADVFSPLISGTTKDTDSPRLCVGAMVGVEHLSCGLATDTPTRLFARPCCRFLKSCHLG